MNDAAPPGAGRSIDGRSSGVPCLMMHWDSSKSSGRCTNVRTVMTNRGIFKATPVSTKSVGIRAARPDSKAVRGSEAMKQLVRSGSTKPSRKSAA